LAGYYDAIDLFYSWNGDYTIGQDGDLKDTSYDGLRSLKQEIHTICASALNDWAEYPGYAAGLDDFVGRPNIPSTAAAIEDRVRIALTANLVVLEEDLSVKVIPVHRQEVLIVIKVHVIPTTANNLVVDTVSTALVFDFVEQGITFLEKVPQLQRNLL